MQPFNQLCKTKITQAVLTGLFRKYRNLHTWFIEAKTKNNICRGRFPDKFLVLLQCSLLIQEDSSIFLLTPINKHNQGKDC